MASTRLLPTCSTFRLAKHPLAVADKAMATTPSMGPGRQDVQRTQPGVGARLSAVRVPVPAAAAAVRMAMAAVAAAAVAGVRVRRVRMRRPAVAAMRMRVRAVAMAMVVRAMAVPVPVVVPGVAVAVLAQDHKDEHVDEHARQREEEHHCAARRLAHVLKAAGPQSTQQATRAAAVRHRRGCTTVERPGSTPVLPGRARLPSTGTGLRTRSTASTTRMPVTSHVLSTLASAPSTSILWYLRPIR